MSLNKFLQISIAILFCLFVPLKMGAAVLYLEPAGGQYYQGDTFIVDARIDVEKECINTVKADLSFSPDILEAIDFSRGSSILTFWLKIPEINREKGLISFIGGIPGGFCGILPGDIGESNLLGRIIFQVDEGDLRDKTEAMVEFLDSSQVLLNDGLGTPAKLKTKRAIFTILPERVEIPKEEWKEELEKDNILPEPFEIKIYQDPAIFEGKYFIAFHTTDKQTGIDYYEVKEGRRDWQKEESPYLLKDQRLTSIIKVKAVDKAGNERIAEYLPEKRPFPYWQIIIILFIIGVIWQIVKRRKIRNLPHTAGDKE